MNKKSRNRACVLFGHNVNDMNKDDCAVVAVITLNKYVQRDSKTYLV